jgi:hypothetical protein
MIIIIKSLLSPKYSILFALSFFLCEFEVNYSRGSFHPQHITCFASFRPVDFIFLNLPERWPFTFSSNMERLGSVNHFFRHAFIPFFALYIVYFHLNMERHSVTDRFFRRVFHPPRISRRLQATARASLVLTPLKLWRWDVGAASRPSGTRAPRADIERQLALRKLCGSNYTQKWHTLCT